jgi:predicted CoA-substrate-specific enzyme activase
MTDYFAGIDIGSTMTKVVVMDVGIISSVIGPTGPEQRRLAHRVMETALRQAQLPFESITYLVATGYGRINVPFADKQLTEISCHARGVTHLYPQAHTLIDVGGQDSKAIKITDGKPSDFVMNDKCAAGCGRFLDVIADSLGITLEKMDDLSLQSFSPAHVSNLCTVFAEQEVATKLSEGIPLPDLAAGILKSLADRIAAMAKKIKPTREVVMTGGGAKIKGLVNALSKALGYPLLIPSEPLLTGALGAALLGKDMVEKALKTGEPLGREKRYLKEIKVT